MRRLPLCLLLLFSPFIIASRRDEEDSYGDEMMTAEPAKGKKMVVRPSRVRSESRGPRASSPTMTLRQQEEFNCPIGCSCNKTTITCQNIDSESNLFLQIQPIAFPHLDTLILTGNRFADLASSGLFGNKKEHEYLTLANLSDNRISSISQQTFINMPHLEYLYLSNNLISKTSKNPFGGLKKLKKLYLSNALTGKAIDSDRIGTLFEARSNQLQDLESIDLSSNKIKAIDNDAFCMVVGVAELLLGKNILSAFEVDKNCLNGLRRLDLSGNLFTSFSTSLFDSLPNLSTLDISDNPIECDCNMKSFIEFAQKDDTKFLNQDRTQCASPQALNGKSIFRVKLESVCVPKSSNIFSNLFLLALFGVVAFFVYRFYRHRIPTPAVFQFGPRHPTPGHDAIYREIGEGGRIVPRENSLEEEDEDSIFENPLYTFDNPAWAR
ncbi:hypothetical protein PFISCL1PPCAC_18804 [Pristionchus fissidentatus]|uniref:LRRCT domain-containing protein n=1 Tax=Pristionchus fissidentatus TaxID=1538716 RepID=A0AAV5WBW8_9BILA|nr:hypothetical protein PFISCL1PPCAC_18804 [Pristionchus fissidentatus]